MMQPLISIRPPWIVAAFSCKVCRLAHAETVPTKAAYGQADVRELLRWVAKLAGKRCGCEQ